ncbi:cytochrome P450 82A4-like, partial [Eucalyptus grandis]|uniref:cytochrome P450 82A4-like n=1 Tax=Eucalyptus grandis TaxID=71139 RepID=UPI00192EEC0D
MADEYGPVFTIRLGLFLAIVVSSSEIAKECYTKHDLALASRPKLLATEVLGFNYAFFVLDPYGLYWREVRKIATLELLSNRRIESLLKAIVASATDIAITVALPQPMRKRRGDALPFLRWLDLGGQEKSMKRTAKELDTIISGWLEEHKRINKNLSEKRVDRDSMDVMLSTLNGMDIGGFDPDKIVKATCL